MLRQVEGSRERGRHYMRWIDSTMEAIALSLQEASRVPEGRILFHKNEV